MNQALESALAKVLRLPDEKQTLAAELLEEVAAGMELHTLSPATSELSSAMPWNGRVAESLHRKNKWTPPSGVHGLEGSLRLESY